MSPKKRYAIRKIKLMKKLLFLLPLLAIISCTNSNNPYKAKFNEQDECLECDNYIAGESFMVGGVRYEVVDRTMLVNAIADGDDLTRYCTSRIRDMNRLFSKNDSFNQDISSWDVSNVTDMSAMFNEATAFNQDIGNWDVYSVTNMSNMFYNADVFNQDIGGWAVDNVTNMGNMFYNAYAFNQDLTKWCVPHFYWSSPIGFSNSNANAFLASNHPVWGTCP